MSSVVGSIPTPGIAGYSKGRCPMDTFVCDECGRTFPKGDDAEALAEMKETFGDVPEKDRAVVCDDCYKEILGRIASIPRVPLSSTYLGGFACK